MRKIIALIALMFIAGAFVASPSTIRAAASAQAAQPATVKEVALAFGQALERQDRAAALQFLAPVLRNRVTIASLPAMTGLPATPLSVHVIRWSFVADRGNATIDLRCHDRLVTDVLVLQRSANTWQITAIQPQNKITLQQNAEKAVVTFCDAAVRHDRGGMWARLAQRLAAHHRWATVEQLLDLAGPVRSYTVQTFRGDSDAANVVVSLQSDTTVVRDRFVVINDRDGWRIVGIDRLPQH